MTDRAKAVIDAARKVERANAEVDELIHQRGGVFDDLHAARKAFRTALTAYDTQTESAPEPRRDNGSRNTSAADNPASSD
jgi:hypothetical protein